jgi:hypothetical protein
MLRQATQQQYSAEVVSKAQVWRGNSQQNMATASGTRQQPAEQGNSQRGNNTASQYHVVWQQAAEHKYYAKKSAQYQYCKCLALRLTDWKLVPDPTHVYDGNRLSLPIQY